MKRYTFFTDDYPVVTCNHCYEDQNENYTGPAIDRLAEYESTGLMPAEVAALQYQLKHVRRTLDAVEVVHGYTIVADEPIKVLLDRKCGICDQLMLATDNYCPMCGAKNEGEKIDGLLFADMEEIIDATD